MKIFTNNASLHRIRLVTIWSSIVILVQVAAGLIYSSLPWYVPLFSAGWVGLLIHWPVLLSDRLWKKVELPLIPATLVLAIAVSSIPLLRELLLGLGLLGFFYGFFVGKVTRSSYAALLLLALVIIGFAWGAGYRSLFPVEAAISHNIHHDTMLHSALASFIGNNAYPSVGIAGTAYFPYNWLCDYLVAAMALGSHQPAYIVLCLNYPVVAFSLFLFIFLTVANLKTLRAENILIALTAVLLQGFLPAAWLDRLSIWPDSFVQEPFLLSVGLLLIAIQELASPRRGLWGVAIVLGLSFLTGIGKVSAVFVLAFVALTFLFQRGERKQSLLNLLAVGLAGIACYLLTRGASTDIVWGPLANLRTGSVWLLPVDLLINFLPALFLGLLLWRMKRRNLPLAGPALGICYAVLLSGVAVLAMYTLLDVRAGAAYYFLETWRIVCWCSIALVLGGLPPNQLGLPSAGSKRRKLLWVPFLVLSVLFAMNLAQQWEGLLTRHINNMKVEDRLDSLKTSAKSLIRHPTEATLGNFAAQFASLFAPLKRPEIPTFPPSSRDSILVVTDLSHYQLFYPIPLGPLYLAGLSGLPVAGLIPAESRQLKLYGYASMDPELAAAESREQLETLLKKRGYQKIYFTNESNGKFELLESGQADGSRSGL